jgi:glycosyltransferase involved in cell wall biosynthesis
MALVIDLPNNLGIGGAVQTGFKYAARNGYEMAVQFDGDGQHLASEIPGILRVLEEKQADMVIGSRFLGQHDGYRSTFLRRFGIRAFEGVNSLLIGQRITDNTSGFRAYNQWAIEFLAVHYPVDYPEPEAVILLGRNGFTIAEEPARMRKRQGGGSSITGFKSAYYMIKVLLAVVMTSMRKPVLTGKIQDAGSATVKKRFWNVKKG